MKNPYTEGFEKSKIWWEKMIDKTLRIGDLVQIPPVQTVIRLEEGRTHPETISKSFVFTEEVASHFSVLAEALFKDHGRGYFLQGDFGSGKSHFLASLTAWLSGSAGADILSMQHSGLHRVADSGRKILPVDVSLINYRATTSLEQILVEAIETALLSQGIEIQLTPLAAFLDNFKTLLQNNELAAAFGRQAGLSDDETESYLAEQPRRAYVEGIRFMKSIGMELPERLVEERHETFAKIIKAVRKTGYDGLMLIIDELSEFFRSKPDARNLNEDARTLQLIGELTATEPIWIIAAVQESIERAGDIAPGTFRKIKDRFPVKFMLSTVHIKALISGRLVRPRVGFQEELYNIFAYLRRQFPSITWSFEDFQATYPVHPTTIALLEGLGDLFSEHRGIVDFVHSRLAGDQSRQIAGILDQPSYELLGPDSIYEHFWQRMSEFSAFHVYPKYVVPHLDDVIERTIDDSEDRALARRIVRVLVLYTIHPTADIPTVKDLTELVVCALSDQDPNLNIQFVAEALLDNLVEESRFLVKRPSDSGDPLETVYEIVTQENPSKILKARIARRAAEIPSDDTRLLIEPYADLPESTAWPGPRLLQHGIYRLITWRQSSRRALVSFLIRGEEAALKDRICEALSSADCEFAVVISLGQTDFSCEHTAMWEITLPPGEKEAAVLKEFLAAGQICATLRSTNPADAPLLQPAKEAVVRLTPAAQQAALRVFYTGNFTDMRMAIEPVIRHMKRFDGLLEIAGHVLLENRYPGFREIAPRKAIPSRLLYQRLIEEFISPGSLSLKDAHSRGLSDALEGLAMPLGLVELRSGTYIFAPDPENHPLLSTLFSLLNTAGPTRLPDVLQSLRTGRFGVPKDTSFFLLLALTYGGLISLLKNNRAIRLEYLRLAAVENADALAPGEVIGKYARETLINECTFLAPAGGWESFGLRQQREAWQGAVKFRDWAQKAVADIKKFLTTVEGFSAFEAFDLAALQAQLEALSALAAEIKVSYPAREGLEQFLEGWRHSGFSAEDIDLIMKLRSFLSRHAEQFVFVNHYVRHSVVDRIASADEEIAASQKEVLRLLDNPHLLIKDKDPALLTDAFDRFRSDYMRFYRQAHADHYAQFEKKPFSRHAKRAFAQLQRLAAIDILDRPTGMNDLLREMAAPRRVVCKRNLAEELLRAPVCNCGFIPGETAQSPPTVDIENTIEKCIDRYLEILRQAEIREALSARLFALADAAPDTAARLRDLNNLLEGEKTSSATLLDVLDDVTTTEISKALSGRVTIERRGLKELVTRLGGRRLAPNQLLETVKEWISAPAENTVIALEDDGFQPAENMGVSPSWWSMLHRELFREDAHPAVREIEAALERQHPAAMLRSKLTRLDDSILAQFLAGEPFHTNAIRTAWLLLAERILSGAPWPAPVKIDSRHVDDELAANIKKRLNVLNRIVTINQAHYPARLRLRIALSAILADSWTTPDLRSLARQKIQAVAQAGHDWLETLPAVAPIALSDNPIVIVIDAVSPDVWLETLDQIIIELGDMRITWQRLEVPPKTAPAVAALFGFSGDALDEFHARGIDYHQVRGNETYGLKDILPEFSTEKSTVVRVSLVDEAAHAALLRLSEMPAAICGFLEKELPRLQEICTRQHRRLILTTDHGLSLTARGLSHGTGGVFEQAVFRVQWKPDTQ